MYMCMFTIDITKSIVKFCNLRWTGLIELSGAKWRLEEQAKERALTDK